MFASTKIIKRTLCEDIWRCSDFLIQSQYSASLWDSVFFYSILPKSELLIIQHIDCYVADFQNNPFTKTISLKWAIWKLIALTCAFWSLKWAIWKLIALTCVFWSLKWAIWKLIALTCVFWSLKWAIWKLIAFTCVFWSLFTFVTFVSFSRVGVRYNKIGLIFVYRNSVAITFMPSLL